MRFIVQCFGQCSHLTVNSLYVKFVVAILTQISTGYDKDLYVNRTCFAYKTLFLGKKFSHIMINV